MQFQVLYDTNQERDRLFNVLLDDGILTQKTDMFGDACGLRISIGLGEDTSEILGCLSKQMKNNNWEKAL